MAESIGAESEEELLRRIYERLDERDRLSEACSHRCLKLLFNEAYLVAHEYSSIKKAIVSVVLKFSYKMTLSVAFKVEVLADFINNETDSVIEAVIEGKAEHLKRHVEVIYATIIILREEADSLCSLIRSEVANIKEEEASHQRRKKKTQQENALPNLIYGNPNQATINAIFKDIWKFIDIINKALKLFVAEFNSMEDNFESFYPLSKLTECSESAIRRLVMIRQLNHLKEWAKVDFSIVSSVIASFKIDQSPQWLCAYCPQWNDMSVTTCVNCRETIISKSKGKNCDHSIVNYV